MPNELTSGALLTLCQGGDVENPLFQVLNFKKVVGSSSDRYRIFISDGKYSNSFSMLATQLNHLVSDGMLENFCIIKVKNCNCSTVQAKKVLVLTDVEVVEAGSAVGKKLGQPIPINADGTVPVNKNPPPPTAPAPTVSKVSKRSASEDNESTPSAKRTPLASNENKPRSSILEPRKSVGAGSTSSFDPSNVTPLPINALTPYQNKWVIKARITNKSDIRTWNNSRGQGKLFSMDLIDESGEIRATAFNDQCDKFYNVIEVGKVYYITSCSLKPANRQYTTLNNEYEMSFRDSTEVHPCRDEASVPTISFDFVAIKDLAEANKDAIVDVLGVCKSAGETTTFTSKNKNKDFTKRDIILVDKTMTEINLTLWGNKAETFDASDNPVVAIKGAKVSDFNGVSLSALSSSVIQINPDLPQSHTLKGWFQNEGSTMETSSLTQQGSRSDRSVGSNLKTLGEVKVEQLGTNAKPDYYSTTGFITVIKKENVLYKACTNIKDGKACNKKVTGDMAPYTCEKCMIEREEFAWRMILQFSIADMTDNQWVTCFQEQGESILGISADELGSLYETDRTQFEKILTGATFQKFNFRLSCREDNYKEERRVRHVVQSINPVDVKANIKQMIKDLEDNGFPLPSEFDKQKYL